MDHEAALLACQVGTAARAMPLQAGDELTALAVRLCLAAGHDPRQHRPEKRYPHTPADRARENERRRARRVRERHADAT